MDRIVMAYLTKKGYANAQSALRKDSRHAATLDQVTFDNIAEAEASVSNYVLFYNSSENNPRRYEESYTEIKHWIEGVLENYRVELSKILFPLFVHSYLNLIHRGFLEEARQFMQRYRGDHAKAHADTVQKLANVTLAQHIKENEAAINLRTQRLNVEMSQPSFELLIDHLQQKGQMLMLGIINQYLHIHVIKGNPSDDDDALTSKMIMTGERLEEVDEVNHKDVMWGLLDEHLEVRKLDEQAAQEDREAQRQKQQQQQPKKKVKFAGDRQNMQRGKPADIQVKPPRDRLPYPEMSDEDIAMRLQVLKELRQAVTLGPTSLPSVCMYTMLNTQQGLNSVTFSDNVKMMANGFQDSSVRVWSLTGEKLRVMKDGAVLREMLNEGMEAEAFTSEMLLDPSTGSDYKTLLGHSGPVYNTSFSPDNRFLLSCSEDSTVRLWSLQTYTNLVCYKGHNYPVWDVQFSPLGYYFVTGSCVGFHPNANYVASGSSDKTCRLWDLLHKNGCVRLFADHKAPVTCIATSPCGRFLASAGEDKSVVVWDIGEGRKVGTLLGHDNVVYSLAFSVDSSVLASGSGDNTVRLWDVKTMQTEKNSVEKLTMNDAVAPRRLMDVSRHKLGQRRHINRLLNKLLIQSVYRCAEEEDIVRSFAECIPDDLFLGMEVVPTPAPVLCETTPPAAHRETPLRPPHAECKRRASSENVALPSALRLTSDAIPTVACTSPPFHTADASPVPRFFKRSSACLDDDFDLTAFQGVCEDHSSAWPQKRSRQEEETPGAPLEGSFLPADCLFQMDCSQDPAFLEPWSESAFSLSQEGGVASLPSVHTGEILSPESQAPTSPLSDDAGPMLSLSPEEMLSKPFASDEFFLSPAFFDLAAAPFALQLASDGSVADKALSTVPTKATGGAGPCVSVFAH